MSTAYVKIHQGSYKDKITGLPKTYFYYEDVVKVRVMLNTPEDKKFEFDKILLDAVSSGVRIPLEGESRESVNAETGRVNRSFIISEFLD
jgi:hypothetical protein